MTTSVAQNVQNAKKILVVDDDGGLLNLIVKTLIKQGYEAAAASQGSTAVEEALSRLPDLLLLDQKLNDMTGRDVVERLAEQGVYIPFLIMTGQGDERLAVDMMKFGAQDYLVKDTDFLDLLPGVLERVFRNIETEKRLYEAEKERERLQNQLLHAQKMESVGRLAGGVAHDFNNMLGAILGYAELALQELKPTDKLFDYLEQIRRAAGRSAELTRQLLAFARRQTVAPEVIDLNKTISEMLKMLQRLIGENIELVFKQCSRQLLLKIDPSQIDQILTNLCVNARDAISANGRIVIETGHFVVDEAFCKKHEESSAGSEYVVLTVCDNGSGMNEEVMNHLFEPFFTTKGVGKGTGLGLATIYGIVRQNDGLVEVASKVGTGSTFRIFLPCHCLIEEMLAKTREIEDSQPKKHAETVLLVEDEPAVLMMTEMMLKHLGYRVLSAGNAEDATRLARANAKDIDLLVTDVIMPEVNGRDLAKRIREICPDVALLFMSGYTADIIAQHGIVEEDIQFIQKPFNLASFAAKITEVLACKTEAAAGKGQL